MLIMLKIIVVLLTVVDKDLVDNLNYVFEDADVDCGRIHH